MATDAGGIAMVRVAGVILLSSSLLAAPVPKGASPRTLPANSNALLKSYAGKLATDASTQFQGWEVGKLVDGQETTSWYSIAGDSPRGGKQPWVRVTFPANVTVNRVTVLGNREPNYPTGYFALAGFFELLDSDGNVIQKTEMDSKGDKHDFDLDLVKPVKNVRAIRFTATKDEGERNSKCIGLAEMLVE